MFKGKTLLITGGTGKVSTRLCGGGLYFSCVGGGETGGGGAGEDYVKLSFELDI